MAGAGSTERVGYGENVDVTGQVPQGSAGQNVRLEHAPAGESWRTVETTSTSSGGSYRFDVKAEKSGSYRAVAQGAGTSSEKRVTVIARLSGRSSRYVKRGSSVRVKGSLRPGLRGRRVALQLRSGGRWKTVDRARTGSGGRFKAAFRPRKVGSYRLRVRFGGDRRNAAVSRTLRGKTYVLRPGHASWYGPGLYGNKLGCGGTLTPSTVGVANKSLPCGTKVVFRYKGRTATSRWSTVVPTWAAATGTSPPAPSASWASVRLARFGPPSSRSRSRLERERHLIARSGGGLVEARHPHSEQPHRPGRVEL